MTTHELNRDIKRLWKRFEKTYGQHPTDNELQYQETEWKRLWRADMEASAMKIEQLKAMLRMNGARRYRPLHTMNIYFEPFK